MDSEVVVSASDMKLIYSYVGAPFVKVEEVEITEEEIKEYVIRPCLQTYFSYFPIFNKVTVGVNNSLITMDYPNDTTYGVGGYQVVKYINQLGAGMSGMIPVVGANVFNTTAMINGNTNRGYGTRYGFGTQISSFATEKLTNDAFSNKFQVKHFQDIQNKRQVEFYSNMAGVIEINFCEFSYNVDDVYFQRKQEFLKYTGSNLLLYIAGLREMIVEDFPTGFNLDNLVEKANKIIDKVEERWEGSSNAVALR